LQASEEATQQKTSLRQQGKSKIDMRSESALIQSIGRLTSTQWLILAT